MTALREARLKLEIAHLKVDSASKDLELLQARIFLKYKLEEGDSFNVDSSLITRKGPSPDPTLAPEPQKD